ncbi:hypothetical protein [Brevibacterium album]|uniref:hypothetical protein n=1 Tax=Brevibacterium album TaxID=417948 RepID=UPI0003F97EF7|nr:hypothetical protein [Brevibacterium album]
MAHPRAHRDAARALLVLAATAATVSLTACAADASNAEPETKTFSYEGESLLLETHEVATTITETDREDIRVTRWLDRSMGSTRVMWELNDDTLEIDAGCHGIAICDARFVVEVPRGLEVERLNPAVD